MGTSFPVLLSVQLWPIVLGIGHQHSIGLTLDGNYYFIELFFFYKSKLITGSRKFKEALGWMLFYMCLLCAVLYTRLSELELFLPSFHAQYGYRNKLCAADVVRACEALLESMVAICLHLFCNVIS